MGTTCGFYQLRMANETTVFVPVDNVDGVGLRRAITDEEVERLFSLLGDGNIDSHQNWKGRFKDNSDRMLTRAKFLVVSEITEVMGEKVAEIEVRVEKALERSFAAKAKSTPVKPKL